MGAPTAIRVPDALAANGRSTVRSLASHFCQGPSALRGEDASLARSRRVDYNLGVPITIKQLREQAQEPAACPLCERPNLSPSDHHLVPKSRGGRVTETICRDCHTAIHATFTNKELEREYSTFEALMAHEEFAALIRFIGKQRGKVRTRTSRRTR